MQKFSVDCLIPFYNESSRIQAVLKTALATKEINSVICVNDGSTDQVKFSSAIRDNKKFILLNHPVNRGKTQAIRTGLKVVKTEYVFLIDADLIGLTSSMLSNIIKYTLANDLDMMILRRVKTLPLTKLLKMDILEAGERLLKTADLRQILTPNLSGYELEPAINNYYLRNKNAHLAYTTQTVEQYRKIDKVGLLKGLTGDLNALRQVIIYTGAKQLWHLIRDFKPRKVNL
jgi:glycosyltransferase involved in cell wall biosynthesis